MAATRLEIDRIVEFGRAYLFDTGPFRNAMVFRTRLPGPGRLDDPRGEGYLAGFGTVCPHMGCLLLSHADEPTGAYFQYDSCPDGRESIVCGPCRCHGTSFDLTRSGLVILGPATQNLPQLELILSDHGRYVEATGWLTPNPETEQWPLDRLTQRDSEELIT